MDQRFRALGPGFKHKPIRGDAGGGFEFAREMKDAETGERCQIGERNVVRALYGMANRKREKEGESWEGGGASAAPAE